MKFFFSFLFLSFLFGVIIINHSSMFINQNVLEENINYKSILIEEPELHFQDNFNNSYKIKSLDAKRTKEDRNIFLSKPSIEISSSKEITHNGKALIAELRPEKNFFSLQNNASIRSLNEGKNYELNSNQINFDSNKNTIFSNSNSTLNTETIYMESKNFLLERLEGNLTKITLTDSEILKIDSSGVKNLLGYSKKVQFLPKQELLIMEGSAKLFQDGITISADEIHYDIQQGKILSSKSSRLSKEI